MRLNHYNSRKKMLAANSDKVGAGGYMDEMDKLINANEDKQ